MGEPPFDSSGRRGGRVHTPHVLLLVALTLLALLPFAGKAFHIDDPLFVWTAKRIHAAPLDPYGFTVNWYGTPMRMADVTKNPPLASYVLAAVAAVTGFHEVPLHVAFLIPALAVILFTYFLGMRFTGKPLLAALFVLATPVFLVSSTSVMCDVWMLALWLATIWLWVTGLDTGSSVRLLLAALVASLALLMKYFGIALVPLLLAYTWRRKGGPIAAWPLLIPIVIAAAYHLGTQTIYGRGLLLDAFSYSTEARSTLGFETKRFTGLAFTGGCVGAALLMSLLGSRPRTIALWLVLGAAGTGLLILGADVGELPLGRPNATSRLLAVHVAILSVMGVGTLSLVGADLVKRRDADSLLLALWITGTFAFAAVLNWSTNGRSILPMVPAVGLLIARRLDVTRARPNAVRQRVAFAVLGVAALVAWWVAWADAQHANGARQAARAIRERTAAATGRLLFEGHWGFQYYLEQLGGIAFDRNEPLHPGDILVLPEFNTNVTTEPQPWMRLVELVEIPSRARVALNRIDRRAGFYSDAYGPSPYVFGPVPPDRYRVYEVFNPSVEQPEMAPKTP